MKLVLFGIFITFATVLAAQNAFTRPNLKQDFKNFLQEDITSNDIDPKVRASLNKFRLRQRTAMGLVLGAAGLAGVAAIINNANQVINPLAPMTNGVRGLFIASGVLGVSAVITEWTSYNYLKF